MNILQYLVLSHNLSQENNHLYEIEQERMKYTILAGNPSLYKALYEDKNIEDENINWATPQSVEEMEEWIERLEGR